MKGALLIIAAMLLVSIVGLIFTRSGKTSRIVIVCLTGLGIMALLWLFFLFSLKGMGED